MRLALPLVAVALLASGCASTAPSTVDFSARAAALAQDALIVDTHIDVPYRLADTPDDVSVRTATGDFDHPRAIAGGLPIGTANITDPCEVGGGSTVGSITLTVGWGS